MHKNLGIIIQARTGSRRLPKKILKKILPNKSFLEYMLLRIKKSKKVKKIIIATSNKKTDDEITKIKSKKINFFRGSEQNVLKRYINAADKYGLKHIVRLTADCPFVDAKLIDKFVKKYLNGKFNYLSNVNPPSFPNGFDIEIVSLKLLKKSLKYFNEKLNQEHVTYAIRKKKLSKYTKIKSFNFKNSKNLNHIRLTIDNMHDLKKIKKLAKYINIEDNWKSIYLKNVKINNEK